MRSSRPDPVFATVPFPGVRLPRRPVLAFWLVAVGIEMVLAALFLSTGAQTAVDEAFVRTGLGFNTDLVTWGRLLVAWPAAVVGAVLALGQVAAPDLAVAALSARRGARGLMAQVVSRFRPWSPAVGRAAGLRIWLVALGALSACNLASGGLHSIFVPGELTWSVGWSVLPLLLVAVFLDGGALLEENGWRGYALPLLLARHGPVAASIVLGLLWSAWHYPVKFDAFLEYGMLGGSAYLAAMTLKLVALSIVMTYFWARAGEATLLAVAMHGLSNDSARLGGYVEGLTWQSATVSELDLAVPLIVLAGIVVRLARRHGWGPATPAITPEAVLR